VGHRSTGPTYERGGEDLACVSDDHPVSAFAKLTAPRICTVWSCLWCKKRIGF
jgi:hypothetical protein